MKRDKSSPWEFLWYALYAFAGLGLELVLMGGVDRNSDFYGGNRDKVKAALKEKTVEAMRQAGPKFIAAVGCESPREITHRFVVWREVMAELAE